MAAAAAILPQVENHKQKHELAHKAADKPEAVVEGACDLAQRVVGAFGEAVIGGGGDAGGKLRELHNQHYPSVDVAEDAPVGEYEDHREQAEKSAGFYHEVGQNIVENGIFLSHT